MLIQWNSIRYIMLAVCCLPAFISGNQGSVNGYSLASVDLFSQARKLENKLNERDGSASQSFQQFIHSKPDSTVIGELKPNSSEIDLMLLKNKIDSAIMSMEEMDKPSSSRLMAATGSDCFIEVTNVERVPGKCHRVNNGLPICQSENYMAINTECS